MPAIPGIEPSVAYHQLLLHHPVLERAHARRLFVPQRLRLEGIEQRLEGKDAKSVAYMYRSLGESR